MNRRRRTLAQQRRDAMPILKAGGSKAVGTELRLRLAANREAWDFIDDYNHLLRAGSMQEARRYVVEARENRGLDADGYPVGWPSSWKADLRHGVPSQEALRAEIEAKYR